MSEASIGRGSALMAVGTAVSRVLGLVRLLVLIAVVGVTTAASNAFSLANQLPNTLYNLLVSGAIGAVLVPQVVQAYKRDAGKEYVDRLLTLGFTALAALTVILTVASPAIIWIYGDGADAPRVELAVAFAYWTMPQIFFYGMYALLGQVLNARGSFGPFMWAPAANNIIAILSLLGFAWIYGATGESTVGPDQWDATRIAVLAGGATLGIVAQGLVLIPAMKKAKVGFTPRWDWRGVGLRAAGRGAMWTFLALAIGQVGAIAVTRAASAAPDLATGPVAGQTAYLGAFTIFMLPHSLVTLSLITAIFPRLSSYAADQDHKQAAATVAYGLRMVGIFAILAGTGGALLADSLVRVILPGTEPQVVPVIAQVTAAFLLGLPAFGVWSVNQRAYYAYDDAKGLIPVAVAMAAVVLFGTVGVQIFLPPAVWVAGAALSMSASFFLAAVMTTIGLRRRMGSIGGRLVLRTYTRAAISALVAGAVGWAVKFGLEATGMTAATGMGGWFGTLTVLVLAGGTVVAVYAGMLRLLGVEDLQSIVRGGRGLLSRLRRGRNV